MTKRMDELKMGILLFSMLCLPSLSLAANAPVIVKTIGVSQSVDFGGQLYFSGNDGVNGSELWKTDGTLAGTTMVTNTSTAIAFGGHFSASHFLVVGSTMYMAASGIYASGNELWKTDGTTTGTVLVKDIAPGSSDSLPTDFINLNSEIFFSSRNSLLSTRYLKKSDGTDAGTVGVFNVDGGFVDPVNFFSFNGFIYYMATGNNGMGKKLWKTDGTVAGTSMVLLASNGLTVANNYKLLSGAVKFPINPYVLLGNTMYFLANGTGGSGLWKTDGTDAGTVFVTSNISGELVVLNNKIYGLTNGVLSVSDGTAAGTSVVKDAGAIPPTAVNTSGRLTVVGNKLFFTSNREQLWASDGTTAGTVLVKDMNPTGYSLEPTHLTDVGGVLYFSADDGVRGTELWMSDGTPTGTVLVKDINVGAASSNPRELRQVGNKLYFVADDSVNGQSLWLIDGVGSPNIIPDTTAPVISLIGSSNISIAEGSAYSDAGATATDNIDGDISANITVNNPVNTGVPATYTITYNVNDAAGNAAIQVSRTVIVTATSAGGTTTGGTTNGTATSPTSTTPTSSGGGGGCLSSPAGMLPSLLVVYLGMLAFRRRKS